MGARARLVSAGSEIKLNTPVNAASESVLVFNVTFKVATLTENRHNPCFHALTFTYGPVQYARHDPSCNMSPVHQDASTPRCRPLPSSSPARTGPPCSAAERHVETAAAPLRAAVPPISHASSNGLTARSTLDPRAAWRRQRGRCMWQRHPRLPAVRGR
jgi:hypothetical protein